ncbi:alpha/beta hydrolase [Arthrobacter sp. zg-Y179]|uniref:alpha/beta hydrolase n=1 Tax=Arthrobacter sp. zg-Y179 TaxID=2894188 RepID=UPI002F40F1D0|nr:alpha/beta hydrolase family protein [Arthrobacter sp. zg-Y179]
MSINVDLSGTDNLPNEAALLAAAGRLDRRAERMADTLDDAQAKWQTVSAFYRAPEASLVYTAMDKPREDGEEMLLAVRSSKQALEVFAGEITAIKAKRAELKAKIATAQAQDKREAEIIDGMGEFGFLGEAVSKIGSVLDSADAFMDQFMLQREADQLAADLQKAEQECNRAHQALVRPAADVPPISKEALNEWAIQDVTQAYNRVQNSIGDPTVAMQQYLALLAGLRPDQMEQFLARNPEAALSPPALGSDPQKNKQAWEKLTPEQRAVISQKVPSLVGNLEGIPYSDRIAANNAALDLALAQKPLPDAQRDVLKEIKAAVDAGRDDTTVRGLISFDPTHPPLAALAIGNMDTADNVTWNVPGMGTTAGSMDNWAEGSQNIYDAQLKLGGGDPAVVAWIGYHTPGMPPSTEVLGNEHALDGGERLASSLNGFNAASDGRDTYVSVAAHSYGTTTTAHGLTGIDFDVDSVAFYGSAGLDDTALADMRIKDGPEGQPALFATHASQDQVAWTGNVLSQRTDPLGDGFGSHEFSSEGDAERELKQTLGHSAIGEDGDKWNPLHTYDEHGYLDNGTQSLDSIAKITTGNGDEVLQREEELADTSRAFEERRSEMPYYPHSLGRR